MSDTLVRVSRQAGWGARRPTPGARWCRSTPRRRVLGSTIEATTYPRAYQRLGLGPPPRSASVHALSRSADWLSPFHIRPGRIAGPHPLPSRQFQALFDSLFKVLFIFPSRYLFAIGSGHDGALTLSGAPFQGTWAQSAAEDACPDYNSDAEGDRFSSWAIPGSLAVTKGILISVAESRFVYSRQSGHVSAAHAPRTGVRQQTTTFSFRFLGVIHAGSCSFCRGDTGSHVTGSGRGRGAMMRPHPLPLMFDNTFTGRSAGQVSTMILPQRTAHVAAIRTLHQTIQSVGATGGVYKGQGRSQRELMTRAY
ncbi:hypothetical protein V6N13_051429 [Hibiscus sabdariffa]